MPHCNVCNAEATAHCGRCKTTFYCCQNHQKQDWRNHKVTCLTPMHERDAKRAALARMEECQQWLAMVDIEYRESSQVELQGIRDFVKAHPFPTKDTVCEYIAHGVQSYDLASQSELLCYPLAKRLWDAAGMDEEIEMYMEIRRVGHLLSSSMERMQFHYYLIQHIICGDGIFPEEREFYGLGCPPVFSYAKIIEEMWNGIGDWVA